ncbi:serine/threonine protein kinase [Photobacterium japonica]|uniref:serine/threonine protein kinase n=1 Tax=Photobacterium japonica TaxID=2910235 RepID=UPI003D0BB6FC
MTVSSSITQVYYDLLDLDDAAQQARIRDLAHSHPALHQQLLPLLENTTPLTQLLGFHINQLVGADFDFSGHNIDKYQLTHELGRGGMGVVYAAHRADETFEQQLAIKFIQPTLIQILGKRALFTEAQLLARLNHPCIAKVFDGGEYQECVYIVMERVAGKTLDRFVHEHAPDRQGKLTLFKRICHAIEHAHQNHILHADIKPENILVDRDCQPKLLDFNLTQTLHRQNDIDAGTLIAFSEQYASPEHQAGRFLTQQSDIFSLGRILAMLFPQATGDILAVIDKATANEPQARYASTTELRQDIEHILLCQPISLKQHLVFYCTKKLIQRRPFPTAMVCLLVLSAMVFSSVLVVQNRRLVEEKMVAENMMFEVTSMMFHARGSDNALLSVSAMLDLSRRRILSNPDLPKSVKQRLLMIMMTPAPDKPNLTPIPRAQQIQTTTQIKTQHNQV